ILVELHTERTFRHFPVAPRWDEFALRLASVSLSGHQVPTFCAEDALLMLCVHGAKDFWERLSWIADVAEMIQAHPALDWHSLARRAESLRVQRMIAVGLLLAVQILDVPLPPEAFRRANADRVASEIARRLRRRLNSRPPQQWGACQRFQYRRHLVPGRRPGWEYAWRLAFAPADEEARAAQLPPPLSSLHFALRPLRLLRKHGAFGAARARTGASLPPE